MTDTLGLKKVATLCVLRNKDKFLLLKRHKEPNQNMFVPVGGKIDPFEDPSTAAEREVKEEAGIIIKDKKFCGILTETSPVKYNWISYVYVADIDYMDAPYCNEGILEWVSTDNLSSIPTPLTDLHIFECIARGNFFAFNAIYNSDLELLVLEEEVSGKRIV